MRILVVEDEPRIASFVVKGLRARGYEVDTATTGAEAVRRAAEFDLVVLDLALPDLDGFDALRQLRAKGEEVPVIVLTARGNVEDRVEGLRIGADDYMTKPFAFDELVARIEARLRDRPSRSTSLEAHGITLDLIDRRADAGGRSAKLSAREVALLEVLLRRPEEILSREQLLSSVWSFDFDTGTNVVDVYVGYLRRKLGNDVIETVRGAGYRLGHGDRGRSARRTR
ncbi:MAG TPA: response regulator transcription factor [Gaiellaceae bacterium]|nr:response regulator transcription factor [Gaiellaceae bacterium]